MPNQCPDCEALMIDGVYCHELGCPSAWKDKKIECKNCGTIFTPDEKHQKFCSQECYWSYWGIGDETEYIDYEDPENLNEENEI